MNYKGLLALLILVLGIQSCSDNSRPNYQYFPNMYEPVGYETYADSDAFANGIEAQIPVEGSIARGWEPYDYPDTNEGYEAAKANLNSSIEITDANQANGKELYGIYCAVCHGNKGDGQGILMTREKFLGVPSYADREITPGSIYHVLMYGKNAMGSHAGQVNAEERWQIAQHVMELRSKLVK
ncbi:cytochrome c [Flavobacteriaceae bacterium]|nr:cytochrome c [Flavobacteriaceae bacterium]MDB2340379.1 cytochrome c [Flavobacteriaceae bacterium]MDC0874822.1 cytochrome c [Flavobacteriaceae bacterium]MDC3259635.1 cytochrome c [Flavobacteriaceae bacterium]